MSVFGLRSALIACKIGAEVLPGLSSHSAMATVLSWLAKAGLKLEDRRLQCGHAKPGRQFPLEYSRDAMPGPFGPHVQGSAIRGFFLLENVRSTRWAHGASLDDDMWQREYHQLRG